MNYNTDSKDDKLLEEYENLISKRVLAVEENKDTFHINKKIELIKSEISQALEKSEKYDSLMSANSEVIKSNISLTEAYQQISQLKNSLSETEKVLKITGNNLLSKIKQNQELKKMVDNCIKSGFKILNNREKE